MFPIRNKPFTIPIVANQPTWSPPPPGGEMEMMDLSQQQVETGRQTDRQTSK